MSNEPFIISDSDEDYDFEEAQVYIRELGSRYRTLSALNIPTLQTVYPEDWRRVQGGERTNPDTEATPSHTAEQPRSPRAAESPEVEIFEPVIDPPKVVDLEAGGNGRNREETADQTGTTTQNPEPSPTDSREGEDAEAFGPQGSTEESILAFGDNWEEVSLPKSGPDVCPYVKEFDPDFPESLVPFREKYEIPGDVEIELHFGDHIYYGDYYATVPLMAITEGGSSVPLPEVRPPAPLLL